MTDKFPDHFAQNILDSQFIDQLGYYLPPYAHAYIDVLGQAVKATNSLDHGKLAEYMRKTTFKTVVGEVKFAPNGEWARTRTLMVQYQDIKDNNIETFTKAGTRVVLYPKDWVSGKLRYPYTEAR